MEREKRRGQERIGEKENTQLSISTLTILVKLYFSINNILHSVTAISGKVTWRKEIVTQFSCLEIP